MTREIQLLGRLFIGMALLGCLSATGLLVNQPVQAATGNQQAFVSSPSTGPSVGMTVDTVWAKLLEHNRRREARLQQASYSAPRTYRVKDDKGKVRAEARVLMQYRAPGTKEFKLVSKTGSDLIYGRVLKPLMESEAEAASGRHRQDSALTPANYTFDLLGEENLDGQRCFLVQATPKRADKYLFNGKIWIHTSEFAVVKIAGQPAKNPSFLIKRVNFVRRYQKVGEFWLPLKDESVTQVRFAGTNILTVGYDHYELAQLAVAGKK